MKLYPIAKINLGLHVLGKREDGFHDIETLFYPVHTLFDELEINKAEEFSMEAQINWPIEKDLCVKAFRLMQSKYGIGNVSINLKKNIPTGAGLGGGSSDCAFTLVALNELFDLKLSTTQLELIASELGSDCSFFIRCVPQWGEGKGDVLSEAQDLLENYDIRVDIPDGEHVNTAKAYSVLSELMDFSVARDPSLKEIISRKDISQWKNCLHNDFEKAVFPNHPAISELKAQMYSQGAIYASMSGSGAAVYGIFEKI